MVACMERWEARGRQVVVLESVVLGEMVEWYDLAGWCCKGESVSDLLLDLRFLAKHVMLNFLIAFCIGARFAISCDPILWPRVSINSMASRAIARLY